MIEFHEYDNERDMDAFWSEIRPRDEPTRRPGYIPTIVALLVLSVPWYWNNNLLGRFAREPIAGFPLWMWVSIVASAAVAYVTARASMMDWDDDDPGPIGGK
jgi:hypothetical protein